MRNKNFITRHAIRKFIFVLTAFVSFEIQAQFYQAKNFNAENGLSSPEVYGMLQDSKGYMWFATDMGVSRYNGYEFKNFSSENGLPDNTVFGFCEDSKGRIWFRSFSGKLSYFLNDSIHIIPCNKKLVDEIKKRATIVLSVYVDNADTIWMGTWEKFVIKISPPYEEENISSIEIPEKGEYIFCLDEKALVYGGNSINQCAVTVYLKNLEKIIQVNSNFTLTEKFKHRYFATRMHNGHFLASVDNIMLELGPRGIIQSARNKATIIEMTEDKDCKIISASADGIRFHSCTDFSESEVIPGFEDKIFTGIIIDRENALWLSAEGHGIFYIPFRNGRYYTTEHGLIQSKISSIGEKNGFIITGHLNGSVSIIKGNKIKLKQLSEQKTPTISGNRIHYIYTPKGKNIFASSAISAYSLKGEHFETSATLKIGGARKIIESVSNNVWIHRDRHIVLCNPAKNFKPIKEILFNQYIDDLYEDSKGILWISALNGLWNYKDNLLHYLGKENVLLSARIVNILEDNSGRLWMASRGEGVIVKEGNKYYTIKQGDGLASNMCRNMLIDSNNVVWVGSNNGLSRIKVKKGDGNDFACNIDVYSNRHGLLTNEVNYIVSRGNQLLLAHNNGISVFDPSSFKNNSSPPPVYIINTTINSQVYKADSLRLNYSRNYLKINYEGLSYKNPGSVEYKYKMEGLDTSWVHTKYTSAQFQTLNPGDYKFIVYAKNDDGYWSARPAILKLSILPVWWQTWTFRILSAGFLFLAIYLFVKRRINKIQRRVQEKNTLQSKVASAELKALRSQMNPHFIFNAINSVQHFITSNDPDSSQRYLSKFAKLIRYVVDNSKPTAIPLEKELEAVKLFLDIEALRFEDHFEYEIKVDEKIDPNFIQIPSMLIQPYIENAIWHGLMHKKGKGKIIVSVQLIDQFIKCIIEDNGIGRKKSLEFKSKQNFKTHKSVGMVITQERLEIINQVNNSKLSVKITDVEDNNGNVNGTRVELFIPSH